MSKPAPPLRDGLGREVSYLRLSVTDRCNLSCLYCRPRERMPFTPHADILRYEELLDLVSLARGLGMTKVRLTGGEPFARRDFMVLVEGIRRRHPELDLRITTNATMLADRVPALADLGVKAINISLDSLNPGKFARITGHDQLQAVRRALDAGLAAGLRLKINAVALRGINDDEIADFVRLAAYAPLDVRFIEFMPMGDGGLWRPENYIAAADVLALASRVAELVPEEVAKADRGPAKMYKVAGGLGRFGVISPLSEHFCDTCNRLRITPDGRLRTCLFSNREYKLRPLLRSEKLGLDKVRDVLLLALRRKPLGYEVLARTVAEANKKTRGMSAIGG